MSTIGFQTMQTKPKFSLKLPEDFDQDVWSSKGYFQGAELSFNNQIFHLTFYDSVRLRQTMEADINKYGIFFEENLVVVREINRQALLDATRSLVECGMTSGLVPAKLDED